MSTQPPTRFENYPPERRDAYEGTSTDRPADPALVVRHYVPRELPARPGDAPSSRRTVISLLIAAPIAVLIGVDWLNGDNPEDPRNGTYPWDPSVQASGEATSTGGGVEFTSGANRLTASSIEVPPATRATDQLAVLAKGHRKGFTGKIGRPVDDSTADVQRASMTGSGTFKGKAATLLAELWIADSGSGLLITRIVTARPDAEILEQAQAMVDELTKDF